MPSSGRLGRAMAEWLSPDPDDLVVELGPGTGAITRALLTRGVPPDRLIAIEMSPDMATVLEQRFPEIHIVRGDAQEMARLLRPHTTGARRVGTVISSLPLRQFSGEFIRELADKILAQLRPGGCWVQYSYHLGPGHQPGTEQFHLRGSDVVWLNFPPARVNVYQKLAAAA
jgi:phosphatidylethanolamine/phosphatidyl-N-methylethanolamine N-methyltransferase